MLERITIRVPEDLLQKIKSRGKQSDAVRQSLDRYFYVLSKSAQDVRKQFAIQEILCLSQILVDTSFSDMMSKLDSVSWEFYRDERCNKTHILDKVEQLSDIQLLSLLDAVERQHQAIRLGFKVDIMEVL